MENVRKFTPDNENQKIDLYTYWKVLWRKKAYVAVPVVLALAISFTGVRFLTPLYESATLVSVEEQNILAGTMRRYITDIEQNAQTRNQQFRTMLETRIMSRTFLEMIIRDLALQNSYMLRLESRDQAGDDSGLNDEELAIRHLVGLMQDKIRVEMTMPGLFRISVRDSDAETAYVLATRISNKYIEVTQLAKLQGLRQAGAFSEENLAIYKEQLEESERELERVRRELGTTDVERNPVSATNVLIAEARKNTLDAQVGRSEIDLRQVRERLSAELGLVPSTDRVSSDETVSNIERRLKADSEERILLELSGDDGSAAEVETRLQRHLAMWEELRSRIAEIIADEYSGIAEDVRPLITEYFFQRQQVQFYRSLERKISGYIEQYRTNLSRRPMLQREENRLVHDVDTKRAIYQAFLESKTSTQITEAMQSTNLGVHINIIEPAERPLIPVEPNKIKIIVVALIFGIACGFGSVLVTEYMDDSFRTIEEVQKLLGVPVLGTIPKTISHFAWERKKRGKMILAWIIGLFLFISIVSGALFMYARMLEGTDIGVELSEELIRR